MALRRLNNKRLNSALKGALFGFVTAILLSCSPATRQLLFDIPPPKPKSNEEEILQVQTETGSPALGSTARGSSVHPHDLEQNRPAIEDITNWEEALALLPTSKKGEPDWSAALREDLVKPRALEPSDRDVEVFKLDFFMRAKKPKNDAWFPHSSHLQWMGCESCHPAVFEYLDNEVSMKQIRGGEACGACHGSVAFSAKDCKRCHTKM